MLEGTAEFIRTKQQRSVSIIIPTYNESQNILKLIDSIHNNLSHGLDYEIIIVDDDSPDGTGKIVLDEYSGFKNNNVVDQCTDIHTPDIQNNITVNNENNSRSVVKVINRTVRNGLVPAILQGIGSSIGNYVLIMDADFSHPPELITKIIHELDLQNDIVIASRYMKGGSIEGWSLKRKMISLCATKLAQYGLGIKEIRDPMSGFFAMKRQIIEDIAISTAGYKILLEILAKANYKARIKEIPYTFSDRKAGKSKLDNSVMLSYVKAVCQLYQHGRKSSNTDTELKKIHREKISTVLIESREIL
jgi:dolichol-phosphate mannosyltransferase